MLAVLPNRAMFIGSVRLLVISRHGESSGELVSVMI